MNSHMTVTVHEDFDVITARMQARELARAIGFDLVDQARISLATSSSARALSSDKVYSHPLTIIMERLYSGGSTGMRVICIKPNAAVKDLLPEAFNDTRRMVDELVIEPLPPSNVRVTLIKWLGERSAWASGHLQSVVPR